VLRPAAKLDAFGFRVGPAALRALPARHRCQQLFKLRALGVRAGDLLAKNPLASCRKPTPPMPPVSAALRVLLTCDFLRIKNHVFESRDGPTSPVSSPHFLAGVDLGGWGVVDASRHRWGARRVADPPPQARNDWAYGDTCMFTAIGNWAPCSTYQQTCMCHRNPCVAQVASSGERSDFKPFFCSDRQPALIPCYGELIPCWRELNLCCGRIDSLFRCAGNLLRGLRKRLNS
jgi:hypothetical protein